MGKEYGKHLPTHGIVESYNRRLLPHGTKCDLLPVRYRAGKVALNLLWESLWLAELWDTESQSLQCCVHLQSCNATWECRSQLLYWQQVRSPVQTVLCTLKQSWLPMLQSLGSWRDSKKKGTLSVPFLYLLPADKVWFTLHRILSGWEREVSMTRRPLYRPDFLFYYCL